MAFITKKYLPRRTILRGIGATIALPLLDSMVPAQTPLGARRRPRPKSRLSCIYVPHGATMDKWTPATEGKGFEFTEILTPLEKFRDRVTVVSNLAHANASAAWLGCRRRSRALGRRVPERRASGKDSIRVGDDDRSDRRAAHRPGHAAAVDGAFDRRRGAELRLRATRARTRTRFPGRTRRRRCRWRTTRRWSSRSCSAMAATTPTRAARRRQKPQPARFGDRRRSRRCSNDLPASIASASTEYLDDVREIERRIQKADTQIPERPRAA